MKSGSIAAIQIQKEKGSPLELIQSAELVAGKGIKGDCHYGDEKQITLISSEVKQWITSQDSEGLCTHRFKENIVTRGIDYNQLKSGVILYTVNAKIEIITCGKRCFPECKLVQEKQFCELKRGTAFAKVLKSGFIQIGDSIWKVTGC